MKKPFSSSRSKFKGWSAALAQSLRRATLGALVLAFIASAAQAELRLPHLLSDHAVLERNRPIHIWGWADPSEAITVQFRGQSVSTVANQLGDWELWLAPEQAGGPYTMTVAGNKGETPITLTDLMIGDVWLASGQSNMQIPMIGFPGSAVIQNAAQEMAAANHPDIRLLMVPLTSSPYPLNDQTGQWTRCTPQTVRNFSAVAYLFARDLAAQQHVPVGIIDASWGGTPIESWMSLESLASNASFMPIFLKRAQFAAKQAELAPAMARQKAADEAAVAAGKPWPKNTIWYPAQESWNPGYLFNSMIAPLTPYTLRGWLWYQGETNSNDAWVPSLYASLFPAMIEDWRARWHEGSLPFLYVQISSFYSPHEHWGVIRNAQREALALRNTGMAVSLDLGLHDNVHPPDKQDVASRLLLAADHLSYGENLVWQGPLFEQVTRQTLPNRTTLNVTFRSAQGLYAKGGAVKSFEVEDGSGLWHAASATIGSGATEDQVEVVSPVADPVALRYGWASFTDANLYNRAGLPASTFESAIP